MLSMAESVYFHGGAVLRATALFDAALLMLTAEKRFRKHKIRQLRNKRKKRMIRSLSMPDLTNQLAAIKEE